MFRLLLLDRIRFLFHLTPMRFNRERSICGQLRICGSQFTERAPQLC